MHIRTFLAGGLTGAAIAYLFDPVAGRGRRTRLRDQALARARDGVEAAAKQGRHATNVAEGAIAQMTSGPDARMADATIEARIRAEVLGRADVPKDRIVLEVIEGTAVLRGELDNADEIERLGRRVAAVDGVLTIANLVHLPGEPAPNKRAALSASEEASGSQTSVERSA